MKIISLNSKVTFRDVASREEFTYTILPAYSSYKLKDVGGAYYGAQYDQVFESDADPIEGETISDQAPMAKALLGHKTGDTVTCLNPKGIRMRYYIVRIHNPD